MATFPTLMTKLIYGVTSTSTSGTGGSTGTGGSGGTKAAIGSYYRCDVILPISYFNKNTTENINNNIFGKVCPNVNITPPTLVNGVMTNNLTLFGADLLQLVVNTFNTAYGSNLTTDQFSIKSSNNDQNSTCSYEIYSTTLQIFISCYTQVGIQTSSNILFIDGVTS